MSKAKDIIQLMMRKDAFSQWLGIKIVEVNSERLVLEMKIRKEMTNGFGISHGGICYSLADTALAFASNAEGKQAMSIETSISHLKKVEAGDVLKAYAQKIGGGKKVAWYSVNIINQNAEKVGYFKGTVYLSDKDWEI